MDESVSEGVADVVLGAANAEPREVYAEPNHIQARLLMLRAGGRRMPRARGPVVDGPYALVVRVDDPHGSRHDQCGRVALRHCAQRRRRHVEQKVLEPGPDHPKHSHAEVLVHGDGDLGGRLERRLEGVNRLERRGSRSVDPRLHEVLGGLLEVVEQLVVEDSSQLLLSLRVREWTATAEDLGLEDREALAPVGVVSRDLVHESEHLRPVRLEPLFLELSAPHCLRVELDLRCVGEARDLVQHVRVRPKLPELG